MSYFVVFIKTLESRVFYLNEIILENVSLVFQGLFSIFLGIYLNNVNPVFSSMNELLIYYFFGNAIINSFQRGNVAREIEREVISGNINVHLVKPYDFVVYMLLKFFSHKVYKAIINALIFFFILNLIASFTIPLEFLLRALLVIPFAVLFMFLNNSIFCYLSLIFEKLGRLNSMYSMLSYFIGGGLVSVKYFPSIVKLIPQFFFFGAPLEYIIGGTFPYFGLFVFYLAFFIFLNLIIRKFVYKRLESNG
ncbi:MAG: ABC-2 family transporter protein [Candidatus Nanoarchaeia archaeon]|jgi:ABC-type uncharacterized transport system permease subunit